mgnify:CR=1 FL=1
MLALPNASPKSLLCCSGSLDGGGSERQLWQLTCGVDRTRFAPHIYLLYRRGGYLGQLPIDVSVDAFDDQPPQRLNWPGRLHALQVQHLTDVLKRSAIDVVYDRTFHMTLVTAAACRRAGCPRVSVIVSPPSRDFATSRERFHRFKRRLLARAYADPQAITLAVSQSVADDATEYYRLPADRIVTVPSPVDIDAVTALAAQPASTAEPLAATRSDAELRSEDGSLTIAVVGRLTAEKGHAVLLEALVQLKRERPLLDLRLDVVGDGPLRQQLEQQAKNNGMHPSIHFRGFQANPYPWIRRAAMVCIPSLYEGLPNVALEAMVLGRPLLISHCNSSIADLIGDNRRGVLVPPGDSRSLATALAKAIDSPGEWLERARRAQVWVAEHHGLSTWLEQMSTILSRAVDQCSNGRNHA